MSESKSKPGTAPIWYYVADGERVGPISGGELKNIILTGQITANDLVWREGMPDWVPVSRLKIALHPTPVVNNPPPIPDSKSRVVTPLSYLGQVATNSLHNTFNRLQPQANKTYLPNSNFNAVYPLISGLHRQRFGMAVAAGLGMLATFLPWANTLSFVRSINGTASDGWTTLALFIPAMVLSLIGDRTQPVLGGARTTAVIPAGLATLLGITKLFDFRSYDVAYRTLYITSYDINRIDNITSPGVGLFLLILSGIGFVIVAWALATPNTKNND